MPLEARLFRRDDPGLQTLAAQAAALRPELLEHEIAWMAEGKTGPAERAWSGILGLFQGERLTGYVPFRYRSDGLLMRFGDIRVGRAPYRTIELFGRGVVTESDDIMREALMHLRNLPVPFHAIALEETPIQSPLWQAIGAGAAGDLRLLERRRGIHYLSDLPPRTDEFMERFSAKTRSTWRRKSRRLESDCGALSTRVYERPDDVDRLLQAIDPVFRQTYHYHLLGQHLRPEGPLARSLRRGAELGWLRAYVLFGGERPLAYAIGYVVRRRYFYGMPGYDPAVAADSPGLLLLLRMVDDLIEQQAADVIDFGGGHADYKKLLATRSFDETCSLLVKPAPYAQAIAHLQRGIVATAVLGAHVLERYQLKSRFKNWLRHLKLRGSPA